MGVIRGFSYFKGFKILLYNSVDESKLNMDLEKRTFDSNPFRSKSKFNPSKTDTAIKLFLVILKRNFFAQKLNILITI